MNFAGQNVYHDSSELYIDCKLSAIVCARSFRVSRKSSATILTIHARARVTGLFIPLFIIFCADHQHLTSPPPSPLLRRHTQNFPEGFPVGSVSVSTAKLRPRGWKRQFGNSGFGFGGDFGVADRPTHDGIGKLRRVPTLTARIGEGG